LPEKFRKENKNEVWIMKPEHAVFDFLCALRKTLASFAVKAVASGRI